MSCEAQAMGWVERLDKKTRMIDRSGVLVPRYLVFWCLCVCVCQLSFAQ